MLSVRPTHQSVNSHLVPRPPILPQGKETLLLTTDAKIARIALSIWKKVVAN